MSEMMNRETPRALIEPGESFMYDGILISPHDIIHGYLESEYGKYHSLQRPRFSQENDGYSYDPLETFLADLGDDVHPVLHMLHTHDEIAVPLLSEQRNHRHVQQFSEDEAAEIRIAAVMHDMGECTHEEIAQKLGIVLTGDKKYGTHTKQDKLNEKAVRELLFEKYFSHLPQRLLNRVHAIDERSDPNDFATDAFNVVERFGYFKTSRRAAEIVIREREFYEAGDERIAQLGRLAVIVGHNHYGFLRSRQDEFPYIKQELDRLTTVVV